jgi:hypothetical protein
MLSRVDRVIPSLLPAFMIILGVALARWPAVDDPARDASHRFHTE